MYFTVEKDNIIEYDVITSRVTGLLPEGRGLFTILGINCETKLIRHLQDFINVMTSKNKNKRI